MAGISEGEFEKLMTSGSVALSSEQGTTNMSSVTAEELQQRLEYLGSTTTATGVTTSRSGSAYDFDYTHTGRSTPSTSTTSPTETESQREFSQYMYTAVDHRVRIRAHPESAAEVYGSGPSAMLLETDGMIFPYTPEIQYSQTVNYSPLNLVHVNQDYHYYSSTQNLSIMITGMFTAQNLKQAQYCYAVIHFLRGATKMRFGESDPKRGLPPPVLLLDGYGDHMFNTLPIIITNFSINLTSEVDYVPISVGGGQAWVPTQFNISATCMIQNPPLMWRKDFNLDAFRNGQLLGATKGWI